MANELQFSFVEYLNTFTITSSTRRTMKLYDYYKIQMLLLLFLYFFLLLILFLVVIVVLLMCTLLVWSVGLVGLWCVDKSVVAITCYSKRSQVVKFRHDVDNVK